MLPNKEPNEKEASPETPSYDLSKFELTSILQNNTVRKSITLLGKFPDISATDAAILLLEKTCFNRTDVEPPNAESTSEENNQKPTFFSADLKVQTEFINNIYGSFQCIPNAMFSGVKTTVVYPATEKHIEKYSISQKFLIQETPESYKNITLPFINSSQFTLDWVYNILEHKQEVERIVYENADPETGFILLPDLKWNGRDVETLYLLAISHKHDIKSLRDLDVSHLPLLYNIRKRAAEAIEERYGTKASQLRMYIHYQPSFYHFHVHINALRHDAPGIWCEKSHMLDTVITNLELLPDYYKRATLPFVVFEGSKLLERYEEHVNVRKRSIKTSTQATDSEDSEVPEKRPKLNDSVEVEPGSGIKVAEA